MKILTICGSARSEGNNSWLLHQLPQWIDDHHFSFFDISTLPLFLDQEISLDNHGEINQWKKALHDSDALVISTPEYIHNIPAALKNALEWVYASGELANKKVLPIVFTPRPPRGEKAMQSLLNSLSALEARIVVELQLYKNEFDQDFNNSKALILEAFNVLNDQ